MLIYTVCSVHMNPSPQYCIPVNIRCPFNFLNILTFIILIDDCNVVDFRSFLLSTLIECDGQKNYNSYAFDTLSQLLLNNNACANIPHRIRDMSLPKTLV